jgi:hypothetical protein
MKMQYEPPVVREIGQVHELTMQDKSFGVSDGFTLQGQPIANSSQI